MQESLGASKGSLSTCGSGLGSETERGFCSKQECRAESGAAMVTIPKAEKDVDDFDVRLIHFPNHMLPVPTPFGWKGRPEPPEEQIQGRCWEDILARHSCVGKTFLRITQ